MRSRERRSRARRSREREKGGGEGEEKEEGTYKVLACSIFVRLLGGVSAGVE